MKLCVLGDDVHCEQAKALGYTFLSTEDLEKLSKNKKLVKNLAARHDAFVAPQALIMQVPRLLGPGLNHAGKFPTVVGANESLQEKVD
jgi:large subunit ribosomal protein L10Ae